MTIILFSSDQRPAGLNWPRATPIRQEMESASRGFSSGGVRVSSALAPGSRTRIARDSMSGGFAMRRAIALLFFAIFCLPAQGLPPEVLTLARIRGRVRQTLDKLPDCTCIETVDRFRKPAGKELQPFDRVVLEILFSGDKELFTVPGDTRWEANPSAFLASGMMGNGIFATQLQSIFLNNVSVIAYKGDGSPAGRREARYDFSISRLSSGYTVHHLSLIHI